MASEPSISREVGKRTSRVRIEVIRNLDPFAAKLWLIEALSAGHVKETSDVYAVDLVNVTPEALTAR